MDRSKVLTALSALAHESRLDLIRLLMPHGDEGLAAGEIGRSLGLSASRLSFHLAALEQAGLLQSRKLARNVFYAVNPDGMGGTISYLMNDCCREHPKVMACCQGADRTKIAHSANPPTKISSAPES
jgi:ArsR family transcriptional regulator